MNNSQTWGQRNRAETAEYKKAHRKFMISLAVCVVAFAYFHSRIMGL